MAWRQRGGNGRGRLLAAAREGQEMEIAPGGRAKLRTYIFDSDDHLRSRCSVGSDSAMS